MSTNSQNNFDNKGNILTKSGTSSPMMYIGRVAKDKKPNEKKIFVYVKDLLPFYDGELKPKAQRFQLDGGDWKGEVKAVNVIAAEWMGDDSNRRFPPDVKINEQVRVYIHLDQDMIYWTSMGRDDKVRRTEKLEFNAANTPDEPTDINRENSYTISVDTQEEKTILIQTSKTDEEKFMYMIKIDAKGNSLRINDDTDNEICLESEIPRIYMKNKEGTMLEIAKKNVTIIAPEDVMIKAGRQMIYESPLISLDNNKGGGILAINTKEMNVKGNSVVTEAPSIGMKGAVEATSVVTPNSYAGAYHSVGGGAAARSMTRSAGPGTLKAESYKGASINKSVGTGKPANNTANKDGGYQANRQGIAWEDTKEAIRLICEDLRKIDAIIGYGNNTGAIMAAIEKAVVPNSRGL